MRRCDRCGITAVCDCHIFQPDSLGMVDIDVEVSLHSGRWPCSSRIGDHDTYTAISD